LGLEDVAKRLAAAEPRCTSQELRSEEEAVVRYLAGVEELLMEAVVVRLLAQLAC